MTVQDLIKKLVMLPQDALVVYSVDDEGSSYYPVWLEPVKGTYIERAVTFIPDGEEATIPFLDIQKSESVKAVCIN